MAHIRDTPSLRESTGIVTPSGRHYRWADDEYRPENTPSSETWSDTMPGGFETYDITLPRKSGIDYNDLDRLSTITRYDAGGGVIWDGRLERAPRVSGDQLAISPSAVGWQSHLEDDKSAQMVYRDIDITRWQDITPTRHVALIAAALDPQGSPTAQPDQTGVPTLTLGPFTDPWGNGQKPIVEAHYDAGPGCLITSVYYEQGHNGNCGNVSFVWALEGYDDDAATLNQVTTGDLQGTAGTGTFNVTGGRRFIHAEFFWNSATGVASEGNSYAMFFQRLALYGDHGLTNRGTDPDGGFYDADIIGHAIGRWCPLLSTTSESLSASSFVIPHFSFIDPTTVGEMVRQATRFDLRDWAVWEDKVFWLHDRGARGRSWRARIGPTRLEETGPQVDRLWNSIIVAYQDVDGSTRTVGPVGSGADTEDDTLSDTDPENPANALGIVRRDMLTMGIGTAASAIQVGARFLEESKALDSSGRAVFVGHVQDDRGVLHPYSHVRAGDTVVFTDAADTSSRRIVRTQKTRQDRSCAIDIDAPPEGLQALLERLGVVLVPLGL